MTLNNEPATLDFSGQKSSFWEETWASGTFASHGSTVSIENTSRIDASAKMVKEIEPGDWQRPIALFTFGEESFLASTHGLLKKGDRVIYNAEPGKIGHISPVGFVIEGARTTRTIHLQPAGFKLKQDTGSAALTIWNRPQNLQDLLVAVKWVLDAKGVPERDRHLHGLLQHRSQPISISGQLWGQFANQNMDQLLTALTAHLHLEQDRNFLKVTVFQTRLPTHQTCGRLLIDQSTMKGFADYLSNQIGCTVMVLEFLEDAPLPRKQFGDVPWEDVLRGLGIIWHLETVNGKPVVVFQGLTN